jgi:hypothetical protein
LSIVSTQRKLNPFTWNATTRNDGMKLDGYDNVPLMDPGSGVAVTVAVSDASGVGVNVGISVGAFAG